MELKEAETFEQSHSEKWRVYGLRDVSAEREGYRSMRFLRKIPSNVNVLGLSLSQIALEQILVSEA